MPRNPRETPTTPRAAALIFEVDCPHCGASVPDPATGDGRWPEASLPAHTACPACERALHITGPTESALSYALQRLNGHW